MENQFRSNSNDFEGINITNAENIQKSKSSSFIGEEEAQVEMTEEKSMWVPDSKAVYCCKCQQKFSTLFVRKHHCRICGNVFCNDCSARKVPGKYWGSTKDIKVCEYCEFKFMQLDQTVLDTIIYKPKAVINEQFALSDTVIKRQTKLEYYCNNSHREDIECLYFFSGEKDFGSQFRLLNPVFRALGEFKFNRILTDRKIHPRWSERLKEIVMDTISEVQPSFKDLQDSLDINDFIKVKVIQYKDYSLTQVIDGIAIQKNVASKKMETCISNPRVLLLDSGIGYYSDINSAVGIQNNLVQEEAYYNIVLKKISQLDPNLILINNSISRKIVEKISDKITVVLNMKNSNLKRLSRLTQTNILPSTDLIDKKTILGQCKQFRVSRVKQSRKDNTKETLLLSNDLSLMVFDGCNSILGKTVLLSGPEEEELRRVKECLHDVFISLRDVYLHKFLLYYLNFEINEEMNYDEEILDLVAKHLASNPIEEKIKSTKEFQVGSDGKGEGDQDDLALNVDIGDHLISVRNHQHKLFHYIREKHSWIVSHNARISHDYFLGFDLKLLRSNSPESQVPPSENKFEITRNTMVYGSYIPDDSVLKPNEYEILRKTNSMCDEPIRMDLYHYSTDEDYDSPLGKMIIDLLLEKDQKCDSCKKPKSSHFYNIYKKKGKVTISVLNRQESARFFGSEGERSNFDSVLKYIDEQKQDSQEMNILRSNSTSSLGEMAFADYNNKYKMEVYTYGVCKHICDRKLEKCCKGDRCFGSIVTPLCKMPKELFNFSVSKFFKFLLFANSIRNREFNKTDININTHCEVNSRCSHFSNDIERVFVTNIGAVKFNYSKCPLYIIESAALCEDLDARYFSDLMDLEISLSRATINEIIHTLVNSIAFIDRILDKLKENIQSDFGVAASEVNDSSSLIENFTRENINDKNSQSTNIESSVNKEDLETPLPTNIHQCNAKESIQNIFSIVNYLKVYCNRYIKYLTELIEMVDFYFDSQKFDYLLKFMVLRSKVLFRICQIKLVSNSMQYIFLMIEKTIEILTVDLANKEASASSGSSGLTGLQKAHSMILDTQIKPTKNFSSLVAHNFNKPSLLDSLPIENNLNQNPSFLKLIQELSYIDDHHKVVVNQIISEQDDFASLVCYAMTSDKYKDFINNSHSIKLTNVKCNRTSRGTTRDKSDEKSEEIYETSLIFDINRNSYTCQETLNINQQLEAELLSDDKNHFVLQVSNTKFVDKLKEVNIEIDPQSHVKNSDLLNHSEHIQKKLTKGVKHSLILPETSEVNPEQFDIKLPCENITKTLFELETLEQSLSRMRRNSNCPAESRNDIRNKYRVVKPVFIENAISNNPIEHEITIYYPRQFEALRLAYCSSYDDFILSICYSFAIDITGGKSKAKFFKSVDNKYILKVVQKNEFKMFIDFGFHYFHHNAKFLFHRMPSALAKILGAFKIKKKVLSLEEKVENYHVILMENLSYGKDKGKADLCQENRSRLNSEAVKEKDSILNSHLADVSDHTGIRKFPFEPEMSVVDKAESRFGVEQDDSKSLLIELENYVNKNDQGDTAAMTCPQSNSRLRMYDLKGSKQNRYIEAFRRKPGEVLLDTNFKEDFNGEPIIVEKKIFELFQAAIHNDSLLLCKMNVMDYSLFLLIDDLTEGEVNIKSIRIGIIDYVRKYTWDKHLERIGKNIFYREKPTIADPDQYKERFKEAMNEYFMGI